MGAHNKLDSYGDESERLRRIHAIAVSELDRVSCVVSSVELQVWCKKSADKSRRRLEKILHWARNNALVCIIVNAKNEREREGDFIIAFANLRVNYCIAVRSS